MYLIDKTYFTKKLSIPMINEPTSEASLELEGNIDMYVIQFLKDTLGNILFEDLKSYIIDGELDENAPLKWLNLVNGCSYTISDKVYTWEGLIYTQGAFKISLLANYVYLNQYQTTTSTQLGRLAIESKNGILADSKPHLIEVYNDFVKMYQGDYANYRNYANYSNINGTVFCDYLSGSKLSGYVSFLQFLKHKPEDYLNAPAKVIKFKNTFGI